MTTDGQLKGIADKDTEASYNVEWAQKGGGGA